MMCEELSRQPDLLRTLSDSAGLNVENCESFLDKAIVSVLVALGVLLFIRVSICHFPFVRLRCAATFRVSQPRNAVRSFPF